MEYLRTPVSLGSTALKRHHCCLGIIEIEGNRGGCLSIFLCFGIALDKYVVNLCESLLIQLDNLFVASE